jgi:TPP-dependent trihydroxycyclohexane-1,2-dione (THcHDO) dehydratase
MKVEGLLDAYTNLENPDFAKVAQAIGFHAQRVERAEGLEAAVRDWIAAPGPALLDVVTDRMELDGIIKDMWVDHTNGRLNENEAEILDEAARTRREAFQEPRQAARPARTSPPPWKRPTALGSQTTAIARQAGLD